MSFGWPILVIAMLAGVAIGLMLNYRLMQSAADRRARAELEDEQSRLEQQRENWRDQLAEAGQQVAEAQQQLAQVEARADRAERLAANERQRRENAVAAARRIRGSAQRGAKTAHPATGPGDSSESSSEPSKLEELLNPTGHSANRR